MLVEEISGSGQTTAVKTLEEKWRDIVDKLDFAFQPIVNIHTGYCFGYEALMRNYAAAGFDSIRQVIDTAYSDNMALFLDLLLREKAIRKIIAFPHYANVKLFYNIDNRTLLMPDGITGEFLDLLERYNYPFSSFCLEISEKHDFDTFVFSDAGNIDRIKNRLTSYKKDMIKLAIDDFGSGLSGLELLYHSEPNYIKIDRFFISEIEKDSRKKLFVSAILNIAHKLGISVIAEGVETEKEYFSCKQIGCNYIQGYLVEHPVMKVKDLKIWYEIIPYLYKKDNRGRTTDQKIVMRQLEYIEPITLQKTNRNIVDMKTIFETFRNNKVNSFFPIINGHGEPIGVIREKDLKEYVYSPYGRDLLQNETAGNLSQFVSKIPISEVKTKLEKILELYSFDPDSEGILLTDKGQYIGFLSANSMLKLVYEKNVSDARDQNPLTKLPGNNLIHKYIIETVEDSGDEHLFVYFDIDHFKPFNDNYGFRQGDRAILIFADILREISNLNKCFIGHIGGDDFFLGVNRNDLPIPEARELVVRILKRFPGDVLGMYKPEDRDRGYIVAADRDGKMTRFPLLQVSAGMLIVPPGQKIIDIESMFLKLAGLKKKAKQSPEKCHCDYWEG